MDFSTVRFDNSTAFKDLKAPELCAWDYFSPKNAVTPQPKPTPNNMIRPPAPQQPQILALQLQINELNNALAEERQAHSQTKRQLVNLQQELSDSLYECSCLRQALNNILIRSCADPRCAPYLENTIRKAFNNSVTPSVPTYNVKVASNIHVEDKPKEAHDNIQSLSPQYIQQLANLLDIPSSVKEPPTRDSPSLFQWPVSSSLAGSFLTTTSPSESELNARSKSCPTMNENSSVATYNLNPCSHRPTMWKHLRTKSGMRHLVCTECGHKWRRQVKKASSRPTPVDQSSNPAVLVAPSVSFQSNGDENDDVVEEYNITVEPSCN